MGEFSPQLVDKIALDCIQLYNTLQKFGKPVDGEWTVLTCIIQLDTVTKQYEIVSLGTGSKCIGATRMSPEGDTVNDSHAEVFARRGFMLYLYENIRKAIDRKTGEKTIFEKESGRYKMRDNIEFIFYSSQMPCGDASIVPKCNDIEQGVIISSRKRDAKNVDNKVISKIIKTDIEDIHRTGAKCLPHNEQDSMEPGLNYHLLGKVRTKPGRGDRTLSVSCSDKLARWIHVGIQGALLDLLLTEPIYIKHFIFGSGVPYSKESLVRALYNRNMDGVQEQNLPCIPNIYYSSAIFNSIRTESRQRPAPGSIVMVNNGIIEVGVQGKRLGVTKKNAYLKSSSLCISKYKIYQRFINLLEKDITLRKRFDEDVDFKTIPYNVMKKKSTRYYENWHRVRDSFFKTWTIKPDMWSFCVLSTSNESVNKK